MSLAKKIKSFFGVKDKEETATYELPKQRVVPGHYQYVFSRKIRNKIYFRKPQLLGALHTVRIKKKSAVIRLTRRLDTEFFARRDKMGNLFKSHRNYCYTYNVL